MAAKGSNLLEVRELLQRGVGAETILKILGPLVARRKISTLARLSVAKTLEDFLEIQAESKVILAVISELSSITEQAQSIGNV